MKINELYRELIVKHYKNPYNQGLIKEQTKINNYFISQNKNVSCGDEIIIQTFFKYKTILDIRYEAEGCAILIASASLMSMYLNKKTFDVAIGKIKNFCNMLQNKKFHDDLDEELKILQVIKHFPGRIQCAIMPWKLLLKIIQNNMK